ncbi:spore coat protein CotH [Paenibacillus selenitireducens]|uniref:Spore coat protein CotH n=1 Tax=Paenibacillus selenitireducens TaxID=1324314 RepID=A0A1T2XN08_9BACL|nr:CotH kinase family protein [Paenibacillus selenitireducens]OPA81247.1 spore coat protein CotH [Paenibacillus selenitireducens]
MKTRKISILLCICAILLTLGLTGCAWNSTSSPVSSTEVTEDGSIAAKNEQPLDEKVFPKDKVIDVKITVDPDDFQDMLDHASQEEFKEATVDYNGQILKNVGIRTKGNLSLSSVVNSDSDRYSFKLSFDEYVNQTLNGISKINLNNNYSDASYMREFLSYELAEAMGLPTPKFSYVNVYVNDKLWGFYLAVEQIGDAYLERNFGNAYGALYKANGGTGSELNWLGNLKSYTGLDLKSASSNNDVLLTMLDVLNNGSDYERVLDVDEALKYIALNAVAGNMDSYLSEKKHNYYLYENKGIFSVLPWDYNMSFGGFGGSGILIDEPTSGTLADRPLVAKLLQNTAYKEKYHHIVQNMLEGYLSKEQFATRIQQISDMISTYVKADPSAFYTYDEYEKGVTQVVSFNTTQTENIAKQLDGTKASSGDGSGSGSSGFGGGGGGRGGRGEMGGDMPAMAPNSNEVGVNGQAQQDANANPQNNGQTQQDANAIPQNNGQAQQDGDANPQNNGQAQQGGMEPPDGFGGGGGQPPNGGPNGMGGGGPGGPQGQGTQQQGSATEAIATGVAIVILLLSCAFVVFYNRRRL